jgi:hypothetical protein
MLIKRLIVQRRIVKKSSGKLFMKFKNLKGVFLSLYRSGEFLLDSYEIQSVVDEGGDSACSPKPPLR